MVLERAIKVAHVSFSPCNSASYYLSEAVSIIFCAFLAEKVSELLAVEGGREAQWFVTGRPTGVLVPWCAFRKSRQRLKAVSNSSWTFIIWLSLVRCQLWHDGGIRVGSSSSSRERKFTIFNILLLHFPLRSGPHDELVPSSGPLWFAPAKQRLTARSIPR